MSKFIRVIRNNWKKSAFGVCAVGYGINYGIDQYKIQVMMRMYCEEAVRYGEVPVPSTLKPKNITVILNPAANKGKAKKNFEKYCAPILNLAGFVVDIVKTESEGHARTLAAKLDNCDVLVVAGGDGTLSETVTGLMRAHGQVDYPVGVLPLGRTNSVACATLGIPREGAVSPFEMAEAAISIVRGNIKHVNAFRVDVIQSEEEEGTLKPVFGLSGIKWGRLRDVLSKQDKYWYLGVLRGYAAVLFTSGAQTEPVQAQIQFKPYCDGCVRCYSERKDLHALSSRWYHYFIPNFSKKQAEVKQVDYRKVVNEECGQELSLSLSCPDVSIRCPCITSESSGLIVSTGPKDMSWVEYIEEGWKCVEGQTLNATSLCEAQFLEINPSEPYKEGEEKWFSIDNEEFEVRPIRITLLPKAIQLFHTKESQTTYSLIEQALLGCC